MGRSFLSSPIGRRPSISYELSNGRGKQANRVHAKVSTYVPSVRGLRTNDIKACRGSAWLLERIEFVGIMPLCVWAYSAWVIGRIRGDADHLPTQPNQSARCGIVTMRDLYAKAATMMRLLVLYIEPCPIHGMDILRYLQNQKFTLVEGALW